MTFLSDLIGNPEHVSATAGENLSGNAVIRIASGSAYYADADTIGHAGQVLGITTGAASIGDSVSIQISGEMTEPGWSWSAGPVWLGAAGALTQTPPTTVISQIIGTAIDSTRLSILLNQPFVRAT